MHMQNRLAKIGLLCAAWFAAAWLATAFVAAAATARAEERLVVLPEQFTLDGPEARQTVLVETLRNGAYVGQVRENVGMSSDHPNVVRMVAGVAMPVGNGQATVTFKLGEQTATAQVTVTGMDREFAWSFRNHVEPILAKAGCNSGACHGALAGKKGFKLSLAGYDPVADYFAITHQARARRVVLEDPGRSLVLTKPSGGLPHKGGMRLAVDSQEYRVLAEWIAAGRRLREPNDPRLVQLEILPAAVGARARRCSSNWSFARRTVMVASRT